METLFKFTEKFKEERNFSSCQEARQCLSLIVSKLSSSSWQDYSTTDQDKLILYTCLRLLLRDSRLIEEFMMNGLCLCVLSEELTSVTHKYLNNTSDSESHLETSLVMELTNIIQKLAHHSSSLSALLEYGIQKQLLFLIYSYNNQILQCSLNGLINLSKNPDGRKAILDCYPLESILHIINDNSIESLQASASDLFLLLSQEIDMQKQIKEQDLFLPCLNLVQSSTHDVYVKTRLLESIERILDDEDLVESFKDLGGIAVIIILMTPQNDQEDGSLLQDTNQRLLMACLSLLTSLSLNDICAKQIVDHNGLYLISRFLIMKGTDKRVQLYCMRALRYLFSLERNRRFFKRLFPLSIFEDFINIGHYIHSLSPYTKLVDVLSLLSPEDKLILENNQNLLNQKTSVPLCVIGEYTVLELLGTGAYGSVYKVRKGAHGNLYALKEIQGNHPAFGSFRTAQDRKESIGRIKNEVAMINEKLRHPNIVRYYNCFEESNYLYIEMSLIDGAPLSEFITSMKEKQACFTEERIWHIFSQMIRALRYLHEDKKIVHRDLKPANMILGEQDKLTITDFGLAKHHQEFSVMKSVVGTMVYWCPELVENKEYNKKADIWAAGCILYELASLQPPFYATNLLSLATKIAEGKYDPNPLNKYSPLMKDVITLCLTVEASQRPNSVEIGSMISDYLMRQFDYVVSQLENMSTISTVSAYTTNSEEVDQRTRRRLVFESDENDSQSRVLSRDFSPMAATKTLLIPADDPKGSYTEPPPVPPLLQRHRSYSLSPVPSYRQSRGSLGSALLKVSPQKLREIADPVGDLLQVVHKLIYIFQLNQLNKSKQASDPAYSIVSRYIRNLFSDTTSSFDAKELKNELWKLATNSNQHVTLLSPLPHLLPAALAEYPHIPSSSDKSVTHEQLHCFLEEVLKKTTYYKDKKNDQIMTHSVII